MTRRTCAEAPLGALAVQNLSHFYLKIFILAQRIKIMGFGVL